MADLFLDDFNGYTLGAVPPSPWVVTQPAGTVVTVESDPAPGGGQGRVVRIADTSTSNLVRIYRDFSATSLSRVVFDLKIRLGQTNQLFFLGWRGTSTTNFGTCLRFETTGQIRVPTNISGSPTFSTLQAYSANVWYSIRYIVDPTLQGFRDVTVDGVNYGNFNQAFFAPAELLGFACNSAGFEQGTFYIDDVRAALAINTIQGLVRSAVTGQPILGATVLVLRQSDNTIIATGTTNSAGQFAISVPSPDPTPCMVMAYKGATELGGGRPHVPVGA
jgi:hypothetical protein